MVGYNTKKKGTASSSQRKDNKSYSNRETNMIKFLHISPRVVCSIENGNTNNVVETFLAKSCRYFHRDLRIRLFPLVILK